MIKNFPVPQIQNMVPRQQRLKRSFCGLGADPDTIRLPEGEIAFPYGAGRRSYGAGVFLRVLYCSCTLTSAAIVASLLFHKNIGNLNFPAFQRK